MSDQIKVWDLPVRVFHWLLAGSFAVAYLVAEFKDLRGLHVILGYTATGLILFRIVWGFVGSRFARFRNFAYSPRAAIAYLRSLTKQPQHYMGHNPAGSYAIYGILLLGLATGVTGYMSLKEIGGESFEEVHEVCANIWLGLVIVHVAGVLVGSRIHRENLVRSMFTGYKQGVQRQSTGVDSGVPPARGVGIMIVIAVGAFWIWSFLTGSVPGANERSAREEASGAGHTSEQIEQGREPGRDRLAAGKRDADRDND